MADLGRLVLTLQRDEHVMVGTHGFEVVRVDPDGGVVLRRDADGAELTIADGAGLTPIAEGVRAQVANRAGDPGVRLRFEAPRAWAIVNGAREAP